MASPTDDNAPSDVSRRALFKAVGAASAAAIAGAPRASEAAMRKGARGEGQRSQRRSLKHWNPLKQPRPTTLEAIVARLIPSDENAPGAKEAARRHYIRPGAHRSAAVLARSLCGGLAAIDV